MASKAIRGITVEIGGDTTKLGKALESSEKKSRSLQTELYEIQKALKFDPTNVELLSQKQTVLTQNIGETKKKLDTLKEAEKQVIAQFERGEVAEEQVRALQREIIKTEKSIDSMETELTSTTKALKDLADGTDKAEKHTKEYKDSVEDAKKELSDFKDKAKDAFDTIGKGAGVLAGAVGATAGYAVKLTTDFDKAFNTLITRTGASAEETDELNESMKRVYANNFGESIEDVAESMATVKTNTKLSGEELQKVTEYALLMRDTFDFDVNESTRSAKMLIDQYGISAEEAYNLIAQGAQNGLDKNGDLLDTINEYAVHFKQLGIDAPTMFNMLSNGAKNGTFSVDKLGDAVKEFGIRVKDGTADEAFVSLGLAVGDVSEELDEAKDEVNTYQKTISDLEDKLKLAKVKQSEFNDKTKESTKVKVAQDIAKYSKELATAKTKLSEAKNNVALLTESMNGSGKSVDELKNAFSSGGEEAKQALIEVSNALFALEDPVKQNQLGVELFGTMWEDMGVDGVKALLSLDGSISDTNEALATINEQKYDDIGSALQGLGRTLETDVIQPLGEELKPVVEDAIEYVKANGPQIKDILSKIVSKVGDFVRYVVDNGPAILSVIGGIGAGFVTWKVASLINGVVKAIQAFKLANEGATIAQWAMNVAMNANPIGIIITLIAGLVTAFILLWNNCEGFRNFFINLWEKSKVAFQAFIDWISPAIEAIKGFFVSLWEKIKVVWDVIMQSLQPLFDSIVGAFREAWELIKVIWDYVSPYFTGIWEAIKAVFSVVVTVFKMYFKNAWEAIKLVWSVVVSYFKTIWENIKLVFSVVVTYFQGLFATAWEAIKAIWNNVIGYFKAIWDTIAGIFSVVKNVLSGNWSEAWESIKGIVDTWKNYFSGVWNSIKKVFGSVGKWFKDTFASAWTAIKGVFSNWGEFFSGLWTKIKDTFSTIGTNIGDAIGKSVKAGLNGVISAIEGIINTGINLINGAIGLINEIPGVSIGTIGRLNLPRLARGTVVNRPTIAEIGEDGAEAVVPLEHNTEWLDKVADRLNNRIGSQGRGNDNTLFEKLDRIYEKLERINPKQKIVLDSGVLVGETIDDIDAGLASLQLLKGRGV
jgi:phage-related minor tail protein